MKEIMPANITGELHAMFHVHSIACTIHTHHRGKRTSYGVTTIRSLTFARRFANTFKLFTNFSVSTQDQSPEHNCFIDVIAPSTMIA